MSDMVTKSGVWPLITAHAAHSELVAGWRVASSYGNVESELAAARERLALADVSACSKLIIQGTTIESILADAFGVCPGLPGELVTFGDGWVTKLNRYEYYGVLALGQEAATVETLQTAFRGMHAHVTSLTHGRDALALVGPRAAHALSKLCALDLDTRMFPDRRSQIGSVVGVTTLIVRLDRDEIPWYELHLDRSYSQFVWEALTDAVEEFEGRMIGGEAIAGL